MKIVKYIPGLDNIQVNPSFPRQQNVINGITYGKMSMPKKIGVEDNGTSFSSARQIYIKTANNHNSEENKNPLGNPLNYQSSGQHIEKLKNFAIGHGSTSLNNNLERSFKTADNVNINNVRSALRKVRNRGYVPPKKFNNK